MTVGPGYLRLNRLRVVWGRLAVYDQEFHDGVNIIRGQNGSGKSTIADFIFFVLGGEFDDWKDAAGRCDEAQAEIDTPRGKLTLRRRVTTSQEPVLVYFGSMEDAMQSTMEGWERFPIRRQAGRESFSQVMFRSLLIPEAQSEGAANITMHQVLRLCYSDQRTPAPRLFRFETFDTHSIREAVGDLLCGISGYEVYEIGLELRERKKELEYVEMRIEGLQDALPNDEALNTVELLEAAIGRLRTEAAELREDINRVDELIEAGDVKDYLGERRSAQAALIKERSQLKGLESTEKNLEFELREIGEFVSFLGELMEKVSFAEATFAAIGSIEFTHCPACGEELDTETPKVRCIVCKTPVDSEREGARYNQIRLDLEIQARESRQLIRQKEGERRSARQESRRIRREHEKALSAFDLRYAGGNGPREAFLATRTGRLGHIEAEIDYLLKSRGPVARIAELMAEREELVSRVETLRTRDETLRRAVARRRPRALSLVSDFAASILRSDLPRQTEFMVAESVAVDFRSDAVSVGGLVNFAESSNVFLKNAAVLALLLAAGTDEMFHHPRFLLIDNVEDKGMEERRSHLFQRIIVERVTELTTPYQVVFTTSMMNPTLELEDYTIGPLYTGESRSLNLGRQ